MVPSDYRLFPKLKEYLRGRKFSSDNEWFEENAENVFGGALEM